MDQVSTVNSVWTLRDNVEIFDVVMLHWISIRIRRCRNDAQRFCCRESYLEESGEDVELKDGDVVVAREVDGGLESHGLQARADRVKLVESLAKCPPRHDGPSAQWREAGPWFKKLTGW